MIFDLLGPPAGPRGRGQKKMCRWTPHSCDQLTKFGWILSNGLGGNSVTDGRAEAIAISPTLFKKSVGINSNALKLCSEKEVSTGTGPYPIP